MFDKILIANRGEIACRVIKTANKMGIKTVAVYSEADAKARHVEIADEAYFIGPAAAKESYLVIEKIITVAKQSGAQAIHPGYGFLSENEAFADACKANGIVFIGPSNHAIRVMGSKAESKRLMQEAGVPLVPGYHGADNSLELLTKEAERIGCPLLVKASAGGGGKGMRVVSAVSELADAVSSARREAEAAFGDGSLLLEKYLEKPRHIEIQVFGDNFGNVVYLFERDCSLQRRHQKVIEEAPAPGMTPELRAKMGEAAVKAAKAVNYTGAGTVEFLYSGGEFYFIEMNTRLQVEHPVTEMITGLDLVEWQLRVANNEKLPLSQDQLQLNGHAFEARIYAEDPTKDFLPAIGKITNLTTPNEENGIRIDTGVRSGDEISIYYDPMIAKLIAWGRDRAEALKRMENALSEYHLAGLTTNAEFLREITRHQEFRAGNVDTGFIGRHIEKLVPKITASSQVLAFAALYLLLKREEEIRTAAAASPDPYAPWHFSNGWRLNDDNHREILLQTGDKEVELVVHYRRNGWVFSDGCEPLMINGVFTDKGEIKADLGGLKTKARVVKNADEITVFYQGLTHKLQLIDPVARAAALDGPAEGRLTAPMPGKVVKLLVAKGDKIEAGTPLIVLEAMKMEHTIKAPQAGTVAEIFFAPGEQVQDGSELLKLE